MLMVKNRILMIVLMVIVLLNVVFLIKNGQIGKDKDEGKIDKPKYVINVNENKTDKVKILIQDKYCVDFNATATEKDKIAQDVSIVQLISNPKEYHCKRIRIKGYAVIEFEEFALYFHYDDYKYFNSKNALALDFSESKNLTTKNLDDASNKYVLIEGNFDAYQGGYNFSGSINNITRLEVWLDRFELRKSVKKRYSR